MTSKERTIKSGKTALIPNKNQGAELRLFIFYFALNIYTLDSQNLRKTRDLEMTSNPLFYRCENRVLERDLDLPKIID